MKKELSIEGMTCMHCVNHVTRALSGIKGVRNVRVSLEEKMATLELKKEVPDKVLSEAVEEAGYKVTRIL
ncbi:MAG: heavy metal-associated domain-containing protein [Clostridia bacterium]